MRVKATQRGGRRTGRSICRCAFRSPRENEIRNGYSRSGAETFQSKRQRVPKNDGERAPFYWSERSAAFCPLCTRRRSKTMSVKGEKEKCRVSFIAHFTRSESNALQLFISLKFHGTTKSIQRERSSFCVCCFFMFTHIYVEANTLQTENTRSGLLRFEHRSNYSSLSRHLKSFNGGVMRL